MKILIIEDHKMFYESISTELNKRSNSMNVDYITNIDMLKNIAFLRNYDIILMDINLAKLCENIDGFILTRDVLKLYPDAKIIMLTAFDNISFIDKAKECGARGFFSKDKSTSELINVIYKVYEGQLYFEEKKDNCKLTRKELEVALLYCSGLSRSQVAKKCYISMSTLASYLNSIYSKLEVRNYQEFCIEMTRQGYTGIL